MKKFFIILTIGFILGILFDRAFLINKYALNKLTNQYSFKKIKMIYNVKKSEIRNIIIKEIPEIMKKMNYENSELKKSISDEEKEVRKSLILNLQTYLGKKYIYGGADPEKGFDCSGLTYYCFKEIGIDIPRTAAEQYKMSKKKKYSDINIGDLVFFEVYPDDNIFNFLNNLRAYFIKFKVTHVGIYTGENKFIHSPRQGKEISISNLNNKY